MSGWLRRLRESRLEEFELFGLDGGSRPAPLVTVVILFLVVVVTAIYVKNIAL